MSPRNARIGALLAFLAVVAAACWWWTRPERQIRAILDDVAAALTDDRGESSLQALAAVAALEKHLAPLISVQTGDAPSIEGRDAVITAGARWRARTPAMRVRFLDPRITFSDDRTATLVASAEALVWTGTGEQRVDRRRVTATITRAADRWVVSIARASPVSEPLP